MRDVNILTVGREPGVVDIAVSDQEPPDSAAGEIPRRNTGHEPIQRWGLPDSVSMRAELTDQTACLKVPDTGEAIIGSGDNVVRIR